MLHYPAEEFRWGALVKRMAVLTTTCSIISFSVKNASYSHVQYRLGRIVFVEVCRYTLYHITVFVPAAKTFIRLSDTASELEARGFNDRVRTTGGIVHLLTVNLALLEGPKAGTGVEGNPSPFVKELRWLTIDISARSQWRLQTVGDRDKTVSI